MNIPEDLLKNSHFARYFRTWEKNRLSIVFVPLAQICRENGHFQEAREICERGLSQHPHSVSGRLLLARICFDLDDYEKARGVVEEILSEMPAQNEARSLLERINRCCGPDKNAPLKESSSLWENLTMAKIYADQGETKIALRIVGKILSRDPQNERARQLRKELTR